MDRVTLELDTAAAAIVRDHPFVPRGEWWTVCGQNVWKSADGHPASNRMPLTRPANQWLPCGLAEAAHASTTLHHEALSGIGVFRFSIGIDHEGTT